jgi:hypothetical protein
MPLLSSTPQSFNDPWWLPTSGHLLPGAAGRFFRLPPEERSRIDALQREAPRLGSGIARLADIIRKDNEPAVPATAH